MESKNGKYYHAKPKAQSTGRGQMYVYRVTLSFDDFFDVPIVVVEYCYNINEAQYFSKDFIKEIEKFVSFDYIESE